MLHGGVFMLFQSMINFIYLFLRVSGGQNFPPPLSADLEKEYFKKAREGDALAREKLIEHNLRLVAHIVKKYYTSNKNQEDLISVGTIGLIKAIDSYDIENGTKFATYAGKCLQNEILREIHQQRARSQAIRKQRDYDKKVITKNELIRKIEEEEERKRQFDKASEDLHNESVNLMEKIKDYTITMGVDE